MVKIEKIRIGNVFKCEDETLCMSSIGVVVSISKEGVTWASLSRANTGFEQTDNLIDIEPIYITPKILESVGFSKNGDSYDLEKLSYKFPDYLYKEGRMFYNSWSIQDSCILYLHDLQNLVQDLIGVDLNINHEDLW